jgi:hypothetical protein
MILQMPLILKDINHRPIIDEEDDRQIRRKTFPQRQGVMIFI